MRPRSSVPHPHITLASPSEAKRWWRRRVAALLDRTGLEHNTDCWTAANNPSTHIPALKDSLSGITIHLQYFWLLCTTRILISWLDLHHGTCRVTSLQHHVSFQPHTALHSVQRDTMTSLQPMSVISI